MRFVRPAKESSPHGVTRPNATPPAGPRSGTRFCEALAFVEPGARILKVLETGCPLGVTVEGEKLQDVPAGRPEQVRLTDEWKPFSGVRVTVKFAISPGPTTTVELLVAMV